MRETAFAPCSSSWYSLRKSQIIGLYFPPFGDPYLNHCECPHSSSWVVFRSRLDNRPVTFRPAISSAAIARPPLSHPSYPNPASFPDILQRYASQPAAPVPPQHDFSRLTCNRRWPPAPYLASRIQIYPQTLPQKWKKNQVSRWQER